VRKRTILIVFGLIVAALLPITGILLANSSVNKYESQSADPERDHEEQREQWFRQGRTASGQIPAELLLQAWRQKLSLAALNVRGLRSFGSNATLPQWQNLGPVGLVSDPSGFQSYGAVSGRATAVAIDQNDLSGNTVYLGGAFGGLWKSTNATADPSIVTWTPLLDSQPTLAIGTVALKPDTTGATTVLLVGTGEPDNSADSYYGLGVLRSADSGATWQLIATDTLGHSFKGLAFAKIAFNSNSGDTNEAVAAASNADNGLRLGATSRIPDPLYYSTDAGLNWTPAFVSDDGSNAISPASATDVIFDRFNEKFYAVVRRHGVYSSADGGKTWQRLAAQPGPGLASAVCPAVTNSNCPLFRGHIALQPATGELYVTYMAFDSSGTEVLQGIFRSSDGGNSWSGDLEQNGYTNCGDSSGCGAAQSGYNLYLHAVASGTGTDLYLGGVNIYRCHLSGPGASACAWTNLTHVYGCGNPIAAPSHVHPDQHEMAVLAGNPRIMYFANDGGIYSTSNGAAVDGTCNPVNAASWQNLNFNLGPMTEFVWLSQDGAGAGTLLGGTQDNGSPALTSAGWTTVNSGDGGFNEINPADSSLWYSSNFYVSIQRCAFGADCDAAQFAGVINNKSAADDNSAFYPPSMLDPLDPTKMIVGTCRVWRGPADGSGWPGAADANALSWNFTTNTTEFCAPDGSGLSYLSALAAGGPSGPSGASSVIYAGRNDGHIFVSMAAESGPASFVDRSFAPLLGGFKISAIAVDLSDSTGNTAIVTRMGFGVGHVWRTTNAGANWTDISAALPDAPADSVLIDPADPRHIIVGMDVGVFETHDTGATWAEAGSGLPSVPATKLLLLDGPGIRKLRVATYGRGIWEAALPPAPFFALQLAAGASASATVSAGQSAAYNLSLVSNNGFSGSVNLSCSGAPSGTTCSVSPGSANLAAAGNLPVTVTVTTQAHAAVRSLRFNVWAVALAGCFGVLLASAKKRKPVMVAVLALALACSLTSCGGGGTGATPSENPAVATPAGPSGSTIIVTASSGGQSRSLALKLTIQ
jgi:hypothetical protein